MTSNFTRTAGLTAISRMLLLCCFLVSLFPVKASAQYEFKLKVNHYELLQHLLGNGDEIR